MKWVTRERPRIDRVACAWLIRRFVDPRELVRAQVAQFKPLLAGLEGRAAEPGEGFDQTLAYWRLESARAVMRFLARAADVQPA